MEQFVKRSVKSLDLEFEGLKKIMYYVESLSTDARVYLSENPVLVEKCKDLCEEYEIEWIWDSWDSYTFDHSVTGLKKLGELFFQAGELITWASTNSPMMEQFDNTGVVFHNMAEDVGFHFWEIGSSLGGVVELLEKLGRSIDRSSDLWMR